jgi:farnesyl diphosphate synthase
MGLAFQITDDILDATADEASLGKTAGKDALNNKPTFVSVLGLDKSKEMAQTLCDDAHRALSDFGDARTLRLAQLADFIVHRSQ